MASTRVPGRSVRRRGCRARRPRRQAPPARAPRPARRPRTPPKSRMPPGCRAPRTPSTTRGSRQRVCTPRRGQLRRRGCRRSTEPSRRRAPTRPRGSSRRPDRRSRSSRCCARRQTRTFPGARSPRQRRRHAGRRARGSARCRWEESTLYLDERVDRDRDAVDDEQRVEIDGDDRRVGLRRARDRPTSTSTTRSRSTAGSPRNGPSRVWAARSSIISSASTRSIGTRRNVTSAIDSARMPPMPSITVIPNCGSRLTPAISSRMPRSIGATSTCTSPSSGRAAARSSDAAATTSAALVMPRRTSPRSVLCAMASLQSLTTTG